MGDQHHALGDLIANGNTSDVWEWSPTTVVKVLHPGIPTHWATLEADITRRVHAAGLPAPATDGVVEVDGRPGIVFERIEGQSMWTQMKTSSGELPRLVEELVDLQTELHAEEPIDSLPDLVTRLRCKIGEAEQLSAAERQEALDVLAGLPTASVPCHGDIHPANLLMSPRGWVIVDWLDAANGHPVADFARSSLLMRPPVSANSSSSHLGGATRGLLDRLHSAYRSVLERRGLADEMPFATWEAVLAVARMSEPVPTADLVSIWKHWRNAGPLVES